MAVSNGVEILVHNGRTVRCKCNTPDNYLLETREHQLEGLNWDMPCEVCFFFPWVRLDEEPDPETITTNA